MIEREHISKGLRWKIYARDGFTCRYCGLKPPEAVLHIDHVIAVAVGGKTDEDNLVTACDACNIGKGARPIPPPASSEQAAPFQQVQKLAYVMTEFPELAKNLLDYFIQEAKRLDAKGVPVEATMLVLSAAAVDAASMVYVRLNERGKSKRNFMKICATAYDDNFKVEK